MNNILDIDGEKAVVAYDPDIGMLRGEFTGLNGGADFYAQSVPELIEQGRESLAVFLQMCAEKGIAPRRAFSGKFNIRLKPEEHEAVATAAAAAGLSMNAWLASVIRQASANLTANPAAGSQ